MDRSRCVYLCGPINGLSDEAAMKWRREARHILSPRLRVFDPMSRDYRGKESGNHRRIIDDDMKDIRNCGYILANCAKASWGTAMEIALAYQLNKRPLTFAFGAGVMPSPWLIGHTYWQGESAEAACQEILNHLGGQR